MLKHIFSCLLTGLLFLSAAEAQTKKHLTPEDYGKWQSLGVTDLSPNGEWVVYQITVQEDNDTLFVTNRAGDKWHKLPFASMPEISRDNQWMAYRIGVPYKEGEKLRESGKPVEYKMGLLNLQTGKKEEVKNINRFGFSRNGKYLAVYLAPPKESKTKAPCCW